MERKKSYLLTSIVLSLIIFLNSSLWAKLKVTPDMEATKDEYENTLAQWYVKEGLGLLMEEIVYKGHEIKVDKDGKKHVKVLWADYDGNILKKPLGNSTQLLRKGMYKIIGDGKKPITEKEAKEFYETLKKFAIYADLKLRMEDDYDKFVEELKFLNENNILPNVSEDQFKKEYDSLETWRDELIDSYEDLE